MKSLSEHQLLATLLGLAVILVMSRGAGEIARRLKQPEVLGELLAGFLLGPSVLGAVASPVRHALFGEGAVALALSGLSWIGAIMLLLIAGMEIDLRILRSETRPGALAAAGAIVPSLIAGSVFAWLLLGRAPPDGLFLGVVLSVTAVSVAAKILIERGAMRRRFAQVILAAGVASEVLVWLLVSVVSSLRGSSPLLTGIRSTLFAVGFFLFMLLIGRRFTFWAMRRVGDISTIMQGQLSLVLALTFAAAALTQALGLHALLGAFVVGVLLSEAPRSNERLAEGLQSLTLGLFGPIFFVLAGMRVDILRLGSPGAILTIAALLLVATAVKVGFSALGARLGGRPIGEAALVGVGLNLKGGTDVVVAVVGTELGLLTTRAYSMYALVAILTVLFSPALMGWLERRTPPQEDETVRLASEEAARRSYIPQIERVLVPVDEALLPSLAAGVVQRIASTKQEGGQVFDITQFDVDGAAGAEPAPDTAAAQDLLTEAGRLRRVEVTRRSVPEDDVLDRILTEAEKYDLVAIGACPPTRGERLSLGPLQDALIHRTPTDVLVAVNGGDLTFDCSMVRRILVPTNGLEYSMAAGDIAAALAATCDATLVLTHVVHSDLGADFDPGGDERRLEENATRLMDELAFRAKRFGVEVDKRVADSDNPGEEIVRELEREDYELVVLGGIDRGHDDRPYLGRTIRTVLSKTRVPTVLLVSRAA